MSLIEKIKSDHLAYRKLRDTTATTFLSTLIGEAEMIGKSGGNREVTNQEVIALVKKFIKNINETTAAIGQPEKNLILSFTMNCFCQNDICHNSYQKLI